ncbi:hypothetical protein TTHERM_00354730 (macronuclear) [Tetrahymena thermophila SB210]|uniref:Uncharacterized protein n=1 Tax=Tetrahymena thermophila (strain SB210) TaxID=312017 RepID=Q22Y98_TETTS|nr:hypothetical protein TTHERM_00354730 [Tetrahymena thermophila SB210]EAR90126.3 hypothetical protein TTHERM_00354730 [Tetrahymena thermophila SB210]|eukprot:XP_001010371.3 hypothetical protein TTHERM_00354730 [Tetrahymena thermophila SB210]
MRLLQNQSDSSIISRYQKPKPVLPEVKNFLAEDSIIQNLQQKPLNYDLSSIMPKKIENKQDKEFKPFFNERDRLGRLLQRPKNVNTSTQNNESTLGLSKSLKTANISDTQFQNISRDTNTNNSKKLQNRGSLQLNTVAIMHLNEFYQQTNDQQKKVFQNYQKFDELIEDQTGLLKINTEENENISQISMKDNTGDNTHSKIPLDETVNDKTSKIQKSINYSMIKDYSLFQQLKEFCILYQKQENITPEADQLMKNIAKMYTEKKKRYQIQKQKVSLPSIGQYEITKSDNLIFRKSPNTIICKSNLQSLKKQPKDSLEVFMQGQEQRKQKLSKPQQYFSSLKNSRNQLEEEDTTLPYLKIRNLKVDYQSTYIDEGKLLDQMNQEFYKYPQEFAYKLKIAQQKVQKIQNDLKTWDERYKEKMFEKPKDLMNSL